MLNQALYLSLLFAVELLTIIKGIRHNICRNDTVKSYMSCDNIYIWDNQRKEFAHASNVMFEKKNWNNLSELQGKTVRVIADNMLPYITSNNITQELGGFLGSIWKIIEGALKFKSEIVAYNYDDGLEVIQNGKADIFLAAAVAKKSLKNIKYSQPYFYNWYHVYMKAPEAKGSSSSYLKTLDAHLWFASISMFCTLTFVLWFIIQILNKNKIKREPNVSILSCLLAVSTGFLNQGYDIHLTTSSCRIIIMVSLFFGLLLYSAMNAVLVAKLATLEIKLPFTSLEDLSIMRTYSLCLRTNSFVYNNFTYENRTILSKWKDIVNGPGCLDINYQNNLAKILCNNGLVILENRVVMATVVRNYNITCNVAYLHKKYFSTTNSFLIWNDFEGEKLIDLYVKRIHNSGVLKRLSAKYVETELPENYNFPKSPQVSMQHIDGIIFMYAVAVFLSLLIILFELFYKTYIHKKTFTNIMSTNQHSSESKIKREVKCFYKNLSNLMNLLL